MAPASVTRLKQEGQEPGLDIVSASEISAPRKWTRFFGTLKKLNYGRE